MLREELARVLRHGKAVSKYQVSKEEAEALIALVELQSIHTSSRKRLPVKVRDARDETEMACALGGKANYLVTGDEDLLVLDGDPRFSRFR